MKLYLHLILTSKYSISTRRQASPLRWYGSWKIIFDSQYYQSLNTKISKWTLTALNLINSLHNNEKQTLLDIPQSKSDKFQAIWSGKTSYNIFFALNLLSFALLGWTKWLGRMSGWGLTKMWVHRPWGTSTVLLCSRKRTQAVHKQSRWFMKDISDKFLTHL